jgi:hypothetical protein
MRNNFCNNVTTLGKQTPKCVKNINVDAKEIQWESVD